VDVLINKVILIRETSKKYGDTLEQYLGKNNVSNDPRWGCFAMIFNHSTLTLELMDHYVGFWYRPFKGSKEEADRLIEENRQRCIEQTKMLFIAVMSSIEFCGKESIKLSPLSKVSKALTAQTGRIYLSNIIKESFKNGIINQEEKDKWDRLIWMRNLMVHNNGVADTDDTYLIDEVRIDLRNGVMIQGKLDIFASLAASAMELYNIWINSFLMAI
jgi:hypothetical protein